MRRVFSFLLGAAMGGAVGATIALLLTPDSGDALRAQLRERIARLQTEMQQAAAARQQELRAQLESLRRPPTA